MAFQVLAAQYPTLYTYKWRVRYTDWQPDGNAFGSFLLKTLPRATEVAGVKIWNRTAFAGTGLITSTIRIKQATSLPTLDSTDGQFLAYVANAVAGDGIGYNMFAAIRQRSGTSPVSGWISNQLADTNIYITLQNNAGCVINNLTAGEFDVWLTTYKLP